MANQEKFDPIIGQKVPSVSLNATDGQVYDLSVLAGVSVVYAFPRTSPPNAAPIKGWNQIPGARGCTPQSCAYRDHHAELLDANVSQVFGLSTQDCAYQSEVVERLHLPFSLLSDSQLELTRALGLETFEAGGMVLLKRITLIIRDGCFRHIMFPVTEPDHNASDVIAYLHRNSDAAGVVCPVDNQSTKLRHPHRDVVV